MKKCKGFTVSLWGRILELLEIVNPQLTVQRVRLTSIPSFEFSLILQSWQMLVIISFVGKSIINSAK